MMAQQPLNARRERVIDAGPQANILRRAAILPAFDLGHQGVPRSRMQREGIRFGKHVDDRVEVRVAENKAQSMDPWNVHEANPFATGFSFCSHAADRRGEHGECHPDRRWILKTVHAHAFAYSGPWTARKSLAKRRICALCQRYTHLAPDHRSRAVERLVGLGRDLNGAGARPEPAAAAVS